MKTKDPEGTRADLLKLWADAAKDFDPADLPADEAWKNDLNAIVDGMVADGDNEIKRGMLVSAMGMAASGLEQNAVDPDGTIDVVKPETLYDLMLFTMGIGEMMEAAMDTGAFDPMSLVDRLKLRGKNDVN